MPTITYSGTAYQSVPGESVLETLLRHGVGISNSLALLFFPSFMT